MPKPITVLVAGATGQQGGAVARLLLEKGHRVRALTRRPGSEAAANLLDAGAEIHEGDLDDAASVQRAAEGTDAFFLMATPFEQGAAAEVRQAQRAAGAAKSAGVKQLVYSSVASADRNTGIPHFDSKCEVEKYVQGLGMPYTIVAPAFFMENLLGPMFLHGLRAGVLSMPLPADRSLQMVALANLATFVRLVLERPDEHRGKRIEIASDGLTGTGIAKTLTAVTGSAISYAEIPIATVRQQSEDLARMWEWFQQVGYDCDLAGLGASYPEVGWHGLRAWASEQDWTVLDAPDAEQPTA